MRSTDANVTGALRGAILALACVVSGAAFAGGPLYVVATGGTLKPARWDVSSPVKVYLDKGPLSTRCQRDENYNCVVDASGNPAVEVLLDQAAADKLVAETLAQWSGVKTSSFRAAVVGRSSADITGANVADYIGKPNGGGIQVIYDADGTVIDELTGGDGYGILGIGSPEYMAGSGSNQIVEGWLIIGGAWLESTSPEPISGVVTHEFGHAINLAHSQTNGFYAMNDPSAWSYYAGGPEKAGPDQCASTVQSYPAANQIETMYPIIDPYPYSPSYDSPEMAKVDNADDMAALSSIYPAANYAATTGTLKGRIVAKDGTTPLTGINVIARRVDQGNPFDAMSRISGDATQGLLGPDGDFVMTGLVPGASYVVYIDQLRAGAFSTPKALLLGPEEYWNAGESGDASVDDACASTTITLAAGETRQIQVAVNGIPRAPTFTHIPYVLPTGVSDNGQQVVGLYAPSNESPYWMWDKTTFDKTGQVAYLGGQGINLAISGNGRVVGGTVPGPTVDNGWGLVVQERAAVWTKETGWKKITNDDWPGCDIFHTSVYDLSNDGSTAVGLAFKDCTHAYGYKWTAKTGLQLLSRIGDESARANVVSGDGSVVAGWQRSPDKFPYYLGTIWKGNEQMLLRDPASVTAWNPDGWVGELTAVNSAGTVAVGVDAGPELNDAYLWSATEGVKNLGGDRSQVCFFSWDESQTVCRSRRTVAYSLADDASVITGESTYSDFWNGVNVVDGAIYTPKLGWMQLSRFLQSQGVLEAANWVFLGAKISGDGKTLVGTAFPLASDYFQGFRVDLDQVYVCHGQGKAANTLRVGFPSAMDQHLSHGDAVGFCPGQGPI